MTKKQSLTHIPFWKNKKILIPGIIISMGMMATVSALNDSQKTFISSELTRYKDIISANPDVFQTQENINQFYSLVKDGLQLKVEALNGLIAAIPSGNTTATSNSTANTTSTTTTVGSSSSNVNTTSSANTTTQGSTATTTAGSATTTTSTTTITHNPAYPSLSLGIVTPATNYKAILTEAAKPIGDVIPQQEGSIQGYSLEQFFGCESKNNKILLDNLYRNYSEMSQPDMFMYIMNTRGYCNKTRVGVPYINGIYVQKEHLYSKYVGPNKVPESDTVAISFESNIFKDITSGNATKGRIWIPAGTTVTASKGTTWAPKTLISYRWNAAPEHGQEAVQDMYSIEKTTGETNTDFRNDVQSYPSRDLFFKKRNTTGFGGLLSFPTTGVDQEFMSGRATRLGSSICFDMLSCGGNVLSYDGGNAIKFTPKESGWLYFDLLNSKELATKNHPDANFKANGSVDAGFKVRIEFPSIELAKKVLAETQWDANGEPK